MSYEPYYKIIENGKELLQIHIRDSNWYSSNIFNTIIGGFIGFLFAITLWSLSKYCKNKKVRSNLIFLINCEFEYNLETLNLISSSLKDLNNCGESSKKQIISKLRINCYEKQFDQLVILPPQLMKDIYKIYSLIKGVIDCQNYLYDGLHSYNDALMMINIIDIYSNIKQLGNNHKEFKELTFKIPDYIINMKK